MGWIAAPFIWAGLHRDAISLKLTVVISILTYLSQQPPPKEWVWGTWLSAASFGVGLIAAQLGNSRLPGKPQQG